MGTNSDERTFHEVGRFEKKIYSNLKEIKSSLLNIIDTYEENESKVTELVEATEALLDEIPCMVEEFTPTQKRVWDALSSFLCG